MQRTQININDIEPVSKNGLSMFEVEYEGEYHIYHLGHTDEYIVAGNVTNLGLIPEFYVEKDDTFTLDEQLQAVYELIYESLVNDQELSGHIEL